MSPKASSVRIAEVTVAL